MADLVYDERVGWYDPDEEYCANSDGNLAVGERTTGISMDSGAEDGFWEHVEKLCSDCLNA